MMNWNDEKLKLTTLSQSSLVEISGGNIIWAIVAMVIYDCISSGDFEQGFNDAYYD